MASRDKSPPRGTASPAIRFEATLGAASNARALAAASDLALDRLPDVDRKVRLLLTQEDALRLLERGFEVHLLAAIPVGPLPESLILTDRESEDWLEQQLAGIPRDGSQ